MNPLTYFRIGAIALILAALAGLGFLSYSRGLQLDKAKADYALLQQVNVQLSQASTDCSKSVDSAKAQSVSASASAASAVEQAKKDTQPIVQKAFVYLQAKPIKPDDVCKSTDDLLNQAIQDRSSK